MATLSQIRSRVSRKIQDPDNNGVSAAVVDDEINRSVRYYENERFWFNDKQSNITLTSGSQAVPSIPSDVISELQVNGLTLIDDQVKIDLIKLPPDEFVERDDDQTGRPYYYTYRNGEYLLLPTPNEAYTLQFRYLKKYDDLSGDSDTNDFTDNAEDLIMLHTVKNIIAEDKQDPQLAGYYEGLEMSELKALRERSGNRNGSGFLQCNTILYRDYI